MINPGERVLVVVEDLFRRRVYRGVFLAAGIYKLLFGLWAVCWAS